MKAREFEEAVYRIVARIPSGKVATYGQIALMAGGPQWSRRAGRALRQAPPGLPCHRVVNHLGRLAPGWEEQRALLEREGVTFRDDGRVRLKEHIWRLDG